MYLHEEEISACSFWCEGGGGIIFGGLGGFSKYNKDPWNSGTKSNKIV
jgi:hypothetical protein